VAHLLLTALQHQHLLPAVTESPATQLAAAAGLVASSQLAALLLLLSGWQVLAGGHAAALQHQRQWELHLRTQRSYW
jgi:hypothetical protein